MPSQQGWRQVSSHRPHPDEDAEAVKATTAGWAGARDGDGATIDDSGAYIGVRNESWQNCPKLGMTSLLQTASCQAKVKSLNDALFQRKEDMKKQARPASTRALVLQDAVASVPQRARTSTWSA